MASTLYYHLFHGQSLAKVLSGHTNILLEYSDFDNIIIEAWGVYGKDLEIVTEFKDMLKKISNITLNLNAYEGHINEFATLAKLQRTLPNRDNEDWIAYAHTKGATHSTEKFVQKKSQLLMMNLSILSKLVKSNEKFRKFYNVAGSDLALANFDPFGPAQLHFAGTFWIARVDYLRMLPEISKHVQADPSSRYYAEAWIGSSLEMKPFNSFCSYRYHYDDHSDQIIPECIEREIYNYINKDHLWENTQEYFDKTCQHYRQKLDSITSRIYPLTINTRRAAHKYIRTKAVRSKLFRILESIFYRLGITDSKFALYSMDVPSQTNIYKSIDITTKSHK